MDKLEEVSYFATPIYVIDKPEFLEPVNKVSERYLDASRNHRCGGKEEECDKNCVTCDKLTLMSGTYAHEPEVTEFAQYVSQTAWNILSSQGFNIENAVTYFTEMWTQEHHKHSAMEQHVHGFGAQIVGFYFLDVPENSSRVVFHDPRAGKVQCDLPQQDMNQATIASGMINFEPKPGLLIFANAWLAHSFTRHAADKPMKFVHFNLNVHMAPQQVQACPMPAAEVV